MKTLTNNEMLQIKGGAEPVRPTSKPHDIDQYDNEDGTFVPTKDRTKTKK